MAINLEGLKALTVNRPTRDIPLPGTEDTARLRKMTVAEYRAIMAKTGGKDINPVDYATDILSACWVDDDGANLFTSKESRAVLDALASDILTPMVEEAIDFSGLDVERAGEAAEKN